MNDVAQERARLLLEDAERMGKPITVFHLEELAKGLFRDLNNEDRRAVVNLAMRTDNTSTPDVDTREFMTPEELRALTRAKLLENINVMPQELWQTIVKDGRPRVELNSWKVTYFYPEKAKIREGTDDTPASGARVKDEAPSPAKITTPRQKANAVEKPKSVETSGMQITTALGTAALIRDGEYSLVEMKLRLPKADAAAIMRDAMASVADYFEVKG